jgi:hypothetical protein
MEPFYQPSGTVTLFIAFCLHFVDEDFILTKFHLNLKITQFLLEIIFLQVNKKI